MEFSTYVIRVSFERDGQRLVCNTPEVLGTAYDIHFSEKEDALEAMYDFQDDAREACLYATTTYTVEEVKHTLVVHVDTVDTEEEVSPEDLVRYVTVDVTLDDMRFPVATKVGVLPYRHATLRETKESIAPHCLAWQDHVQDLQEVPPWAVWRVKQALTEASLALFREVG
jgi:hypothetical protein